MRRSRARVALLLALVTGATMAEGCTGVAARKNAPAAQRPDYDPLEPVNRRVFWFNDKVDVYVLEPVARGWHRVLPDPVERSVTRFFLNLRSPVLAANDLLQGKPRESGTDVARFGINTTVGVLGFLDPATGWGYERNEEDFGQTLGVWGILPGPYLVLPIFGPSNPRDTVGLIPDWAFSLLPFFVDSYILMGGRVIDVVNTRAQFLAEVEAAKDVAVDYYVFVRDAYFQRRNALVNDNVETPTDDDGLYNLDQAVEP